MRVILAGSGSLGDLVDLDYRLQLTVAVQLVHALLGLVTDGGDLVGLSFVVYDGSANANTAHKRSTNSGLVAIDDQQSIKLYGLVGVFHALNGNSFAFRDDVLLTTGCDYCFFH